MPSPHPPLHGTWLSIVEALWRYGPSHRTFIRRQCNLTNRGWKLHSRLMKMRGLINIHADGVAWLTDLGHRRYAQTIGLSEEPSF